MKVSSILCLLLITALTGCASAYKQSENSLKIQKSMSKKDATKILQKSLSKNTESVGICTGTVMGMGDVDGRTRIQLKNDIIYIKNSYIKGDFIRTVGEYNEYKKVYINKEIKLSEINKIRIQPERDARFCSNPKGENMMLAYISTLSWFAFDVKTKDMDKTISAIKILRPDIELITGMGF